MLSSNFNKISAFWHEYSYPWRPSNENIEIIKKFIPKQDKTLILGSTKEIRDIFTDRKIFVYDISKNMYEKNLSPNKSEIFLQKDWFTLKNGNYDLILGDLFFNMFSLAKQKNLLEILAYNLSKNGKIIFRAITKNKIKNLNKSILNLIKLVDNISDNKLKFNYITFELVNGLGFKGKQIGELLEKLNLDFKGTFKKEYLDITPYSSARSYVFYEDDFEKIFKNYKLTEISSKKFIFVTEKIYILEK